MDVNLSIKGVPRAIADRLRTRAARNHRSLQGELMHIIETATAQEDAPPVARALRRGTKTIEQIAAEHRALFPEPIKAGPMAVDIIRQDRDSR